jgi:integrase
MSHSQVDGLLKWFRSAPHHEAMIAFVLATGAEEAAILRALRPELSQIPVPLHGTNTAERERSCFLVFDWQARLMTIARAGMDGPGAFAFKEWANSSRDLAEACTALGIPVVSLHGLRHVFTSWALNDGISEVEVAKALGHRDLRQIMATYDDRDAATMQRRAEEMAEARRHLRLRVIEGGKAIAG